MEADETTSRLQEQLRYEYDDAWNLSKRTNNALVQTFSVNNRNQLTSATRSGTMTVAGDVSIPSAGVSVSGTGLSSGAANVYEDGRWARAGATLASGNNSYTATATALDGRTAQANLTVNLPATVNFNYDSRGNLIGDGRRILSYDAENQLVLAWMIGQWRSDFVYDGFGRRRIRKEFTWQGGWVLTNEVHYVYDGRLVVQERHFNPQLSTNLPARIISYTRRNDLSGTLEEAGGIGGLLARTDHSLLAVNDVNAHAYYHADAGGNVTAMVNTNGVIVARYHYDPYGNMLGMSGPLAEANLYRFSSKEAHPQSGLVYYLYRYYDPNLQRWVNRDPIGERGGLNLYQAVYNNPIDRYDTDGRIVPAVIAGLIIYFSYEAIANAPGPQDPVYPPYNDAPNPVDLAFALACPVGTVAGEFIDAGGEALGVPPELTTAL